MTVARPLRILMTCLISLAGGLLFTSIHIPVPWLLGPMIAVLIASRFLNVAKVPLYWPSYIRNAGIMIVGYSIGLAFTRQALVQIVHQLPSMLLMALLLMLLCVLIAYIASRLSGIDFPTMMTGCVPGGLSQMITLAEEIRGVNMTVVTFMQVTRLMMIVIIVPLLVFSPMFASSPPGLSASEALETIQANVTPLFPNIVPFAVVCMLFTFLGHKIKFPTVFLLGPLLGTALLGQSGLQGPAMPSFVLNAAQFMVGSYVGLLLRPEKLQRKTLTITVALASSLVLLVGAYGLSVLLTRIHALTPITGFLSMAPGGMDQMGIIAHEVNADLSIVSAYQLFRTFFIFFLVPSLLRMLFRFLAGRAAAAAHRS
ncbi:AbrB family transcriptional regulator [Paenibacillus beijingensis]|nr:AbrB family transcriptional regulator [Paenibacillus beijingensis]